MRLISIADAEQLAAWPHDDMALPPADFASHAPDAHCVLESSGGEIAARCSLWWRDTPPYPGHRLGVIGHYAACDAWAAHSLLQSAVRQLAARGCTLAVGPMDGNTWRRYRLLSEHLVDEAPFFLEPDNPDEWPQHFLSSGFVPLAQYLSALKDDLSHEDPRAARITQRLDAAGVRIRSLDASRLEEEMRLIYNIAAVAFRRNFLYTRIEQAEFLEIYKPLLPFVQPELVLIAEHRKQPVGFSFSLPDWLQEKRERRCDTVIMKTIAVLPGRDCAGLGSVLAARTQRIARELGYRRIIHALMHEGNNSRNLSVRYNARPFRRYTLYSRRLGSAKKGNSA